MSQQTELQILLTLVDNATAGIKKSFQDASAGMKLAGEAAQKLGQSMKDVGREVSRAGNNLAVLGGAITSIFVKAINDAAKNSYGLQRVVNSLTYEMQGLQTTIASALVPVIVNITNLMANLNKAVQSIPAPIRDQIIQWSFLIGIFATMGGIIISTAGQFIILAGNIMKFAGALIALNPPVAIILGALAAIIAMMFTFQDATRKILTSFETLFLGLKQGFFEIKSALEDFVASGLEKLSILYENLAKLPGPLKGFYQEAALAAMQASNSMQRFANDDLVNAKIAAIELERIIVTGSGNWSATYNKLIAKVKELKDSVLGLGPAATQTARTAQLSFLQISTGLSGALSQLSGALSAAAAENKKFAVAAQVVGIGLAIINTAAGIARAFADWPWPFSLAVAAIVGAAGAIQIATIASQKFHSGGMVRAHDGLAIDEVPIIAQKGEGVLSRKGMAALGGEDELNQLNAGSRRDSGGGMTINVYYPKMTSKEEVSILARTLGLEVERQLRYARGI